MQWESPGKRFWARVRKTTTCWLWTGKLNSEGFGRIYADRQAYKVHRYAFALLVGSISPGDDILHTCPNAHCVNPDHLQLRSAIQRDKRVRQKPKVTKESRMGNSRLTRSQAQAEAHAMREAYNSGTVTQTAIATRYRLSQAQVSRILAERSR